MNKILPNGEDPLSLELDEASETPSIKLGVLLEEKMK